MPDDVLIAKADDGSLARRDVLTSEVARLLASPKAKAGAADVLASQWLDSRGLDHAAPDATHYPLSDELRTAMKRETHLVVQALLAADRPAKDILDVDFTFVNAPLAAHYGLPFPTGAALAAADSTDAGDTEPGDGFVRVSLVGTTRTGVPRSMKATARPPSTIRSSSLAPRLKTATATATATCLSSLSVTAAAQPQAAVTCATPGARP